MSQAASQAAAFYREVAESGRLWTVRDSQGYPAPLNSEGRRTQPFWSSLERVQQIIETVPAYGGFEPEQLAWSDFCKSWVPGLEESDLLVGVNWSGPRAQGYDLVPAVLVLNVEATRRR